MKSKFRGFGKNHNSSNWFNENDRETYNPECFWYDNKLNQWYDIYNRKYIRDSKGNYIGINHPAEFTKTGHQKLNTIDNIWKDMYGNHYQYDVDKKDFLFLDRWIKPDNKYYIL